MKIRRSGALALASSGPCDPKTLTRASRDYLAAEPAFALEAGPALGSCSEPKRMAQAFANHELFLR